MARILTALLLALSLTWGPAPANAQILGGFGSYYSLVRPQSTRVARGMTVTPTIRWNRAPRGPYDISREENWTLNGPLLDNLSFIGGVGNNDRIVRQRRRDDRKVPDFRSNMSPQEIAAMIESFYRIRGGATQFNLTNLQPRQFMGYPGFQFDYEHLGGDEVWRRGRSVGAVIDGKLYLALFDATRMHYFNAGIGEFERIVQSARLRK